MSFDAEDLVCPVLALGAIGGLLWLVVRNVMNKRSDDAVSRLEQRVRELSVRVHVLEKRAAPPETAAEAQSVPAPAVPTAAPPATEWVPTAAAPREEPPPLPPPVPVAAHVTAAPPEQRAAPVVARSSPLQDVSFETFLGGRVLLVVGVIVVLIGVGFFLKYAIDHEWITAGMRVAMGALAGIALVIGGSRMRTRGFDVFGQALMGCGLGALYLTNFFACKRYEFIDRTTAFGLTAVITAAGATLALRGSAPLLAYLGFFGGYLAPAVLGDRSGTLPGLTTWLLLVDAGVLVVLLRRTWQGIELMALAFSALYVSLWLDSHRSFATGALGMVCGCLAALVAASLVMGLLPPILRRAAPSAASLMSVAAAGGLGALAGHDLLFPDHRAALGAAIVGVGVVYLLASRLVARAGDAVKGEAEGLLAFSVGTLALAITMVASGTAVAPALSIAGVAVVFAGTRTRHAALLAGGVAMIVLAFGDLLLNRLGMFRAGPSPFLNERFLAFASPCVAMLVAGSLLSRAKDVAPDLAALVGAAGLWPLAVVLAADLGFGIDRTDDFRREMQVVAPAALLAVYGFAASRWFGRGSVIGRALAMAPLALAVLFGLTLFAVGHLQAFTPVLNATFAAGLVLAAACAFAAADTETTWRAAFRITGLVYLLGLITAELYAWGAKRPLEDFTREEAHFAALVWISIAWAIYAASLVAVGFVRRSAALRWMGLAVFALTLGKVFLVDLAQLATVYRIGSFLVLGALLVAASFLYQRARKADAPPST